MLTWEDLEGHREAGRLVKYTAGLPATGTDGRCLYMLPDVFEAFQKRPWPSTEYMSPHILRERRAAMRQVLERYVKGLHLNVNYDIKELGSELLNPEMRGLFEFRSGPPIEQTRLFGFFARPGAFVATSFRSRGEFEVTDGEDKHSPWASEFANSTAAWHNIFGAETYLSKPWPVGTLAELLDYMTHADD